MTRHLQPVPDQPALDPSVEPAEPVRLPNAGDLVAVWCRQYEDAHGVPPHPSVVRRLAGACRNVGRDCETVEHWRAAWFAARSAGQDGRYDLLPYLVRPEGQPQAKAYSRNAAADLLDRLEHSRAVERRQVRALSTGDDV